MSTRKLRHKILSAYCTYREQGGPRLGIFFDRSYRWWMFAVTLLVAGYVVAGSYFEVPPILSGFVIGVLVGRLLTDLRMYARIRNFWPTLEAVLDWKRVHDALNHQSRPGQIEEPYVETRICEKPYGAKSP